ncbi:MAG TPA: hypothetical protein VGN14_14090, partial [Candidatus Elarobacter sp.]
MRPLAALLLLLACLGAAPRQALSSYDFIALEVCYTTIMARYYRPVDPVALQAGARTGMLAYLRSRGIANPVLPHRAAKTDRYAAESGIVVDVGTVVSRYGSRIRTDDLVNATIAGELAALHDPYSVLFPPAAYKKFVGFLDGKAVAGIGAELDVDPQTHVVRIADVFPGS